MDPDWRCISHWAGGYVSLPEGSGLVAARKKIRATHQISQSLRQMHRETAGWTTYPCVWCRGCAVFFCRVFGSCLALDKWMKAPEPPMKSSHLRWEVTNGLMQETDSRQLFVEVCMCILKLAACNCRQPSMPGIVLCGWYARGIALGIEWCPNACRKWSGADRGACLTAMESKMWNRAQGFRRMKRKAYPIGSMYGIFTYICHTNQPFM